MSEIPNRQLMKMYGTDRTFLEKEAGMPDLAARVAYGFFRARSTQNDMRTNEMRRQIRELELEAARQRQDDRAGQMVSKMRHARVPIILNATHTEVGGFGMGPRALVGSDMPLGYYDEGMVRMASAIGKDMAHELMEKDAGIGDFLGGLTKSLAKGSSNFSKSLGTFKNDFASGVKGLAGKLKGPGNTPGPGGVFKNFAGKLKSPGDIANAKSSTPARVASPGVRTPKGPKLTQESAKTTQQQAGQIKGVRPGNTPQVQAPIEQTQPQAKAPYRAQGQVPQAQPAPPGDTAQAQSQTQSPQPAQTGGTDDFSKFMARMKGELGNGQWSTKLPALAAMGLGTMGAVKGVKGLLNQLGKEPEPATYNEGGAVPAMSVNEYGAPVRY